MPCNEAIDTDVSEDLAALMLETASSSETSVYYHITTRCQNPEDRDLNLHSRENFKPHKKSE